MSRPTDVLVCNCGPLIMCNNARRDCGRIIMLRDCGRYRCCNSIVHFAGLPNQITAEELCPATADDTPHRRRLQSADRESLRKRDIYYNMTSGSREGNVPQVAVEPTNQ